MINYNGILRCPFALLLNLFRLHVNQERESKHTINSCSIDFAISCSLVCLDVNVVVEFCICKLLLVNKAYQVLYPIEKKEKRI